MALTKATKVRGLVLPLEGNLASAYGAEYVGGAAVHMTVQAISSRNMQHTAGVIQSTGYASSGDGLVLRRDASADAPDRAGTNWMLNGLLSGKLYAFDSVGKAYVVDVNASRLTPEALGSDTVTDHTNLLQFCQTLSLTPVALKDGKTYTYTRPINHNGGRGWVSAGRSTFKCITAGSRLPFLTSKVTAQGGPNDTVNGTDSLNSAVFSGITFDCDYQDTTGAMGFQFAEMTLNEARNVFFYNCKFSTSKFDLLVLQNNCRNVQFYGCEFRQAGEDGVTLRKTCAHISFYGCIWDGTAKVNLGGANPFRGDGVVVKAQFVKVIGSHFRNVGDGKHGAGIANNAEDNDTPYQASYNTYADCTFENCYAGIGIGTVNAGMIAAGTLIENISVSNMTFLNTVRTPVSFRQVRNVTVHGIDINTVQTAQYPTVEFVDVQDVVGSLMMKNTQGAALSCTGTSGNLSLQARNVSIGTNMNGVVLSNCRDLTLTGNVATVGRTGLSVSTLLDSSVELVLRGCAQQGADLTTVNNSYVSLDINGAQYNGVTVNSANGSDFEFRVNDAGAGTNDTYSSARFVSTVSVSAEVYSFSGQENKPKYDLLIESGNSGMALNNTRLRSGVTAKYNKVAGASVTEGVVIQ